MEMCKLGEIYENVPPRHAIEYIAISHKYAIQRYKENHK